MSSAASGPSIDLPRCLGDLNQRADAEEHSQRDPETLA